jgi:hypothetical protein
MTHAPHEVGLEVTLEKRTDGDVVLRCTRRDGSTTWQRHTGPRAVFFAYHDLTHLAVERTLGFAHGFFGLIARGWSIDETTGTTARGPLPAEALAVENLVGLFDRERASGATWSAEEFNEAAALHASSRGQPAPAPVDETGLAAARAAVATLHARWRDTPSGSVLVERFDATASSRGSSRGR